MEPFMEVPEIWALKGMALAERDVLATSAASATPPRLLRGCGNGGINFDYHDVGVHTTTSRRTRSRPGDAFPPDGIGQANRSTGPSSRRVMNLGAER
jgi:hypothetical protein